MSEDEFEIILVHIRARARHLIISVIGNIKGGAIAVAGVASSVDVAALL